MRGSCKMQGSFIFSFTMSSVSSRSSCVGLKEAAKSVVILTPRKIEIGVPYKIFDIKKFQYFLKKICFRFLFYLCFSILV
jgi:hypothetical protein